MAVDSEVGVRLFEAERVEDGATWACGYEEAGWQVWCAGYMKWRPHPPPSSSAVRLEPSLSLPDPPTLLMTYSYCIAQRATAPSRSSRTARGLRR